MVKSNTLGMQDVGTCGRCTCDMCQEVDRFLDGMSSSPSSYDGFPPRSPSTTTKQQQQQHQRGRTCSSRYNNIPTSSRPNKTLMQQTPPGPSESFELDRRWPSEYLSNNKRESTIQLSKTPVRRSSFFYDPMDRFEVHGNEKYSICPHMMLPENYILTSTQRASLNEIPTTIGNRTSSNEHTISPRRRNVEFGRHTTDHTTRQVVNDDDKKPSSCPHILLPTEGKLKSNRSPMKRRCSITKFSLLEEQISIDSICHVHQVEKIEPKDSLYTIDMIPIPWKEKSIGDDSDEKYHVMKPHSCPTIENYHLDKTHESQLAARRSSSSSSGSRFQRRCSVTKFSLDEVRYLESELDDQHQDESMHHQWQEPAKLKDRRSNHQRPLQVPPPPPYSNSEPFKTDDLLVVAGKLIGSSSPASRHTPLAGSSSRKRHPTTKVGRAA